MRTDPKEERAMPSITLNGTQTPALDDRLTFTTEIPKLAGWEYPMIDLQAYQDVNADGVVDVGNLQSADVVFTWLDRPDAEFWLGGYDSIWKQRGGGPAECVANLCAYGWHRGKQSIRVLATCTFHCPG